MSDTSDFEFGSPAEEPVNFDVSSTVVPQEEFSLVTEAEIKAAESKMVKVTDSQYTTAVGSLPEGIKPDDFSIVVNAVYHDYTSKKRLPTVQEIQRLTLVSNKIISSILETDEFRQAVTARGIPWDNTGGLTATQMLVAQILTNPTDKRELKIKLRGAGVTYTQYRAWMNQPAFSQYMHKITEGMLTEHIPDFNTVLTKKALAGDLNSIKYINELSGRHDPNRQQILDLQNMVGILLDIIQRNVKDPVAMKAISDEFRDTLNPNTTVIKGELG